MYNVLSRSNILVELLVYTSVELLSSCRIVMLFQIIIKKIYILVCRSFFFDYLGYITSMGRVGHVCRANALRNETN